MLENNRGEFIGNLVKIAPRILLNPFFANYEQKDNAELYNIYVEHTDKTFEEIEKDCLRDNWMTAEEAKEYGLVDEVLSRSNPRNKKD